MHLSSSSLLFAVILFAAGAPRAPGQTGSRPATAPPQLLNMVFQELKPGRNTQYDAQLRSISQAYQKAGVAAYWLEMERPGEEVLCFNFVESFDVLQKSFEDYGAGLAAHPELIAPAEKQLEENVSGQKTALAVRRDDIGYRADTIDFSKMRILRLTTFRVRPGHEAEFVEATKAAAAAAVYGKVTSATAWVVYQVVYGPPSPTFFVVTPMRSIDDVAQAIAEAKTIREAQGDELVARLAELARSAYVSTESQMYFVKPECSHMPAEFVAGDPGFWKPKSSAP